MKRKSKNGLSRMFVCMLSLMLMIGLIPIKVFASEMIPLEVKVVVNDGDEDRENDQPVKDAEFTLGLRKQKDEAEIPEDIEEIVTGKTDESGVFSWDMEPDRIISGYVIKVEHEAFETYIEEYDAVIDDVSELKIEISMKVKVSEPTPDQTIVPTNNAPAPDQTPVPTNNAPDPSQTPIPFAEKAEGTGSVQMDGWIYGEEPRTPVLESSTNGIENVIVLYKVKGADDVEYSDNIPETPGDYTVQVTFKETDEHKEVKSTADFTIQKKTLNIVSVKATSREYIENDKTVAITELVIDGIIGTDIVQISGFSTGTLSSDAVGDYTSVDIDVSILELKGENAAYYQLPSSGTGIATTVNITERPSSGDDDEKENVPEPEEHKHSWSDIWTWDATHHWKTCIGETEENVACKEKTEYAEHIWVDDAVHTTEIRKAYKCQIESCGATKTEEITPTPHEHKFDTWAYDNDSHWLTCSCEDDVIEGKTLHVWVRVPEKDTDTKYAYTCECGAEGVSAKLPVKESETKEEKQAETKESIKETQKPKTKVDSPATGDDINVKMGMVIAILSLAIMSGMIFKVGGNVSYK